MATSFTCFEKLPAELRSRIWTLALLSPQIHIFRPGRFSRSRTNAIVQSCKEAESEAVRLGLHYYVEGPNGPKNYVNLEEDTFWMPTSANRSQVVYLKCGGCAVEEGHCKGSQDSEPLIRRLVLNHCHGSPLNISTELLMHNAKEIFIKMDDAHGADILFDLGVPNSKSFFDHPALEFNSDLCASTTATNSAETPNWEEMAKQSLEILGTHKESLKREDEEIARDGGKAVYFGDGELTRTSRYAVYASEIIAMKDFSDPDSKPGHQFRLLTSNCYHISFDPEKMKQGEERNGL